MTANTIEPLVMSWKICSFGQNAKRLRTQSGKQPTVTSQKGWASSAGASRIT